MVIQHNMQAMNTNRQLGISVGAAAKSTEKLSSGYRINRAGDDAAGLAISEKMRSQIRGLDRASANSQDGISLIQTAEGALNETQSILQRMRELSVQAANGTNTDSDRNEIQKEVNQLTSEINRIANTTEFNTMKLLKGNTNKAEIGGVDTETLKDGAAGKLKGDLDKFKVEQESTKGKESTATLKGNTSEATGSFTNETLDVDVTGKAGAYSTTTVGGVQFKSQNLSDTLNGTNIKIVSMAETRISGAAGSQNNVEGIVKDIVTNTVYIALKQSTIDSFDSVADLMGNLNSIASGTTVDIVNSLNSADSTLNVAASGAGGSASYSLSGLGIELGLPENTATGDPVKVFLPTMVGEVKEGNMQGGYNETLGQYSFELSDVFKEDGDVVIIAGERFTAKLASGAAASTNVDSSKGEFGILSSGASGLGKLAEQASGLRRALSGNKNISEKFDVTLVGNKITLTEKVGYGGAGKEIEQKVSAEGAGEDSYITITNPNGINEELRFKIDTKGDSGVDAKATYDGSGTVTIKLGTSVNGNKASKIQAALRALGTQNITIKEGDETIPTQINFKDITVESFGTWDDETTNLTNISKDKAAAGGGIREKKGTYSFDVTAAFGDGDEVTIAGKTFTAKAKNANVYNGEFAVGADKSSQAAMLAAALSQDKDIAAKYTVVANNGKITLTENEVSGVDMKESDVSAQATGTKGEFKLGKIDVLADGASITIDGQKIDVSSKNAHVGYANGTAIKVADSVENQSAALADAINKNAELSKKYKASVADDGNLMLTQKIGSEEGPEVTTTSSTKGTFDVTFQVGANTGQSMTIAIGDNRANALGVAGDGTEESIMADNGATAYYTKVANVTDGTTNDNIEFALDVTSFEKATAAIGVIDDALSSISAQRSQLGAYQNRLEHTIANLDNTSENLQSSESRIRDVDMAKEMTNFSKNNILQQAAQSMLAQANQSTQGVLTLLR